MILPPGVARCGTDRMPEQSPTKESTLTTFSAEASAALGGPDWLVRRRAEAWDRFVSRPMPTEAEEVWRYSGIDAFDLERYGPDLGPAADFDVATSDPAAARAVADRLGARSALVVTRNGGVVHVDAAGLPEDTVIVTRGPKADEEPIECLGALGTVHDAFGELHDAFLPDVVVIASAPKAVLERPVVVVHLVDASTPTGQGGLAVFPHLVVRAGTSSEAGVIEVLASIGEEPGPALVVPVVELDVGDDARLSYANVQFLGSECVHLGTQASRVGRDATLRSFTAGFGAVYDRVRTDSDLVGSGGRSVLHAAYLGTARQVHDFRTLQDHHAPRTQSELLFEGAIADDARSVYSGLIRIRNGARGSDAFQTNHNLVLSEGAHADSVPNLDIEENDVRCSHASTVGPVDEEQLYYLESRGIAPAVAERLIVLGFFSAMAERAPFAGAGRLVEQTVAERLADRIGAKGGNG
ncbi:MAG TPA: SufD family Fe-S cluster assembly protein [Acidimicrobiales bacterium]|nr:SufD family Fe-S cluster assembly protein [Acidimicrobiales bacterium]